MITQEDLGRLRTFIGKEVCVMINIHSENFYKYPHETDSQGHRFEMTFKGIYGVSKQPLYLLGADTKGELVFRQEHRELTDDEVGVTDIIDTTISNIGIVNTDTYFSDPVRFFLETQGISYPAILIRSYDDPQEGDTKVRNIWDTTNKTRNKKVIEAIKGLEKLI